MPNNLRNYINKLNKNEQEKISEKIKIFKYQFCFAYSNLLEYINKQCDIRLKNTLNNDKNDIKLNDYNNSKINNIYKIHTKSLTLKINAIKSKLNSSNLSNILKTFKNIISKHNSNENKKF